MNTVSPRFWSRRGPRLIGWSRLQSAVLVGMALLLPLAFKQSGYRAAAKQPTWNPVNAPEATPAAHSGEAVPVSQAVETPPDRPAEGRGLRLRPVSVTVPEDPFRAGPADPRVDSAERMVEPPVAYAPRGAETPALPYERTESVPLLPDPRPEAAVMARRPEAGAPAPVRERTEEIDTIVVTGIIHGEPPLVTVRFGGQSHFLTVGDQVGNSWRLAEIGERSATFRRGEQRLEVQITRGGSQ